MSDFRETERVVFDIAVGSMDFGSGFLDKDEVVHLRRFAVHLGADPLAATPYNVMCEFYPPHEWEPWKKFITGRWSRYCPKCREWSHSDGGRPDPVDAADMQEHVT